MRTTGRGGWWLLTAAVLGLLLVKLRGAFGPWLLRRWAWNLWIPILLHAGMNLAWELFDIAGGAVGPGWANLGRAATIALAVWLTLRQTPSPSQEGLDARRSPA